MDEKWMDVTLYMKNGEKAYLEVVGGAEGFVDILNESCREGDEFVLICGRGIRINDIDYFMNDEDDKHGC